MLPLLFALLSAPPVEVDVAAESKFLANSRQVTSGLPRAGEGYFSPNGEWIVYQAYPVGYPFYQIYLQKLDDRNATPHMLSTGRGRTTCAYFSPDGKNIIFASSHTDPDIDETERKGREAAAKGGARRYQWDFDPHMDIYVMKFSEKDFLSSTDSKTAQETKGPVLRRLTDAPGYDAEGSYSPDGKQIVFTSTRDGDPDLYLMDADGSNVRQLTNVPGYDGGPFFSPDGKWVVFRSDRKKEHMLQLFMISVDGKSEVQLTDNLDHVNWCPFFHPSSKYLIWSGADYSKGPTGAHFNLFTMDLDWSNDTVKGGEVQKVTFCTGADVLPVFSPDGKKMMWTSTRTPDGTSQLWIADWLRGQR